MTSSVPRTEDIVENKGDQVPALGEAFILVVQGRQLISNVLSGTEGYIDERPSRCKDRKRLL